MTSTEHLHEARLIAQAQQGDLGAYEDLARAHGDRIYAVILRLVMNSADAEDIAQETLLRGWRGINNFHADARFGTWIYRIAVNESNRFFERGANRRREQLPIHDHEARLAARAVDQPPARAELRELEGALRRAIEQLDPPYRTALVLRDIEGLSTREAAEIVGVREGAFKSRLHQARLRVRAALGDEALLAAGVD